MQNLASTITPYMPGTREVFMSPRLSYLSVDVYRETGEAYLYNGCAIVDRRSGVADMSIRDAQDWCVQYERSLWEAAHEDAITEDAERAGFFEVPVATPVDDVEAIAPTKGDIVITSDGRTGTVTDRSHSAREVLVQFNGGSVLDRTHGEWRAYEDVTITGYDPSAMVWGLGRKRPAGERRP